MIRQSRRRQSRRKQSRRRLSRRRLSRRKQSRKQSRRKQSRRRRVSRKRVSRKRVSRRKNIYRMTASVPPDILNDTITAIFKVLSSKHIHTQIISDIYRELLTNKDFQILGLLAIQDDAGATRNFERILGLEDDCFNYCSGRDQRYQAKDEVANENAQTYVQNLRNKNPLMCQFLCESVKIIEKKSLETLTLKSDTARPPAVYIGEWSFDALTALKLFAEQSIGDNYLEMIENLLNLYMLKSEYIKGFIFDEPSTEDLATVELDYSDEKIIQYYEDRYSLPKDAYYLEWLVRRVSESYLIEFMDGRDVYTPSEPFPPAYTNSEIELMWREIGTKDVNKMKEILEKYRIPPQSEGWGPGSPNQNVAWWRTHVLNDFETMLSVNPNSNKNVLSYLLSQYPPYNAIKYFYRKKIKAEEAPPGMFTSKKFMDLSADVKESLLLETEPDQARTALKKLHSKTLSKAVRDIHKVKMSKQASSATPTHTQFGKHLRQWPSISKQAELKRQELIRSERSEEEKLKKHLTTKYSNTRTNTRTNRERARSYKSPMREGGKICTDVNCSLTVKGPWFPHSHATKLESGKLSGGRWVGSGRLSSHKVFLNPSLVEAQRRSRRWGTIGTKSQQKSSVRAYPSRDDTYFKSFINKQ